MTHRRVPEWITTYVPPAGWTNVFALVPSNQNLYGTETLFGDWNGRTLLLAKDGAPTHVIRNLRDLGDPQPWRAAERARGDVGGYRTNETLVRLASDIDGGILYGSATANLLCDDPRWSRNLPGFFEGPLHEYLKRVLRWVLETMPNVQQIACLGAEAWYLTSIVLGHQGEARDFARYRGHGRGLSSDHLGKKITAYALYHPAARVSDFDKRKGWTSLSSLPAVSQVSSTPEAPKEIQTMGDMQVTNRSNWNWLSINPSVNAKNPSASPTRDEMRKRLERAGEEGVPGKSLEDISGWQNGLNAQKLWKASQLLATESRLALEWLGPRDQMPVRLRIKPKLTSSLQQR